MVKADEIIEVRRGLLQACLTLVNQEITQQMDNPMRRGEASKYLYDMRYELNKVIKD